MLLGACSAGQGPEEIGPIWGRITGPAYEGREPPPGAEAAFPNLGSIPARPTLPDPAVRDALTAALAEERQRSRNPLDPDRNPRPVRPAGTEGDAALPLSAPRPPALAGAPRVPFDDPTMPAPGPAAAPAAVPSPEPALRAPAAAAPAASPPAMDVAPPALPPPDLLAPGGGPPPPPPADLLAPSRR